MTLEELADLIRANSANTNGRIDVMRNETNAALMNIQNDPTDVRSALAQAFPKLDLSAPNDTQFRPLIWATESKVANTSERPARLGKHGKP